MNQFTKFDELARLAVSLEPRPEVSIILGYLAALELFFINNPKHNLATEYQRYSNDSLSAPVLIAATEVALFEKTFRQDGVKSEDIKHYISSIELYRKNCELYKALKDDEHALS